MIARRARRSVAGATARSRDREANYDRAILQPGDTAPDFELPDQDGRAVKLSDFRGTPVVVYFYPKADWKGS